MSSVPAGPPRDLAALGRYFALPGRFVTAARHGSGHINETWAATYENGGQPVRYIHQRLNPVIFPDADAVMGNIARVLAHLRAKGEAAAEPDLDRRLLTLMPAATGELFVRDEEGSAWRTYRFVEGARSFDVVPSPAVAFRAARAFGRFARELADLPPPRLADTIPGFHHTPSYLTGFEAAVAADPENRAAEARDEIAAFLARSELAPGLERLRLAGALPERITHNDTKLNNVLFDEATGEALCVIDLDTVQPGLAVLDFGDMVRSSTSPAPEDERDLRKVFVQVPVFTALAEGFLAALTGVITPIERESLVMAAKTITFECGLRFLTDHLRGDRYFRIHRPWHNLDRCRTQLTLLRSLEKNEEELRRVVEGIRG